MSKEFGLGNVSPTAKAVMAHLLPPAKLNYANGVIVEPQLKGTWNMETGKHKVFHD